jgi:hydrogenase/urease accessory protein HupE
MTRASAKAQLCLPLALAAIVFLPAPATAHLNSTGLGPVYDGVAHFLSSPDDLLAALTLALWAGARGAPYGRRTLFVLPTAWLLASLLGVATAAGDGGTTISALWLLALGALLASNLALPPLVATALAVLLGLQRGLGNGSGMVHSADTIVALVGLGLAVFVVVALAAAFVVGLRAAWARVAVRVIGSWVAASGLLLLGWSLRPHS